jgi:thioredoxin 1
MLDPVLGQLASAYVGRVKFGKMNIDEDSLTAAQFGVKGVPAMLFFKSGKMVSRLVGSQPRGEIERQLQAIL